MSLTIYCRWWESPLTACRLFFPGWDFIIIFTMVIFSITYWGPPCLAASWRSRPSSRCEGQPPCPPSPFPWSPIAAPILPSALGFSSPRRGIKNSKAPGKIADYNFYKVLKRFGSGIPHLKVLKHFTEYIPQLNNPSIKVQPAWVRSRLSSKLCLHCWSPR